MKHKTLFLLKILLLVFLWGGVFPSCEIINTDGENSSNTAQTKPGNTDDSSGGTQKPTIAESIVWSGKKTLDWESNINISASYFENISSGSKIILFVSTVLSAEYHNIKLYNNCWTELSSGTADGALFDNGVLTPSSEKITYALTDSEAQALKSGGMFINGFGVMLTKIVLQLNSRPSSDVSDDNPGGGSTSGGENEMPSVQSGTPFKNHGGLKVSGAYLYDEHGKKYQLYGMSTHGINFGDDMSRYVNRDAFQTLRDDWNINCIRLVLYPKDFHGYCNGGNKTELKQVICSGIDYAAELGMYVIVDWHVHNYNPQETQTEAIAFLKEISAQYATYKNVLYEICNEPTASPWKTTIKPYAQTVIPVIRENVPDAVIIVGTNTWSQDLDEAWTDKLDFNNIMYTFHFYANTHTASMRSRVENAIKNGMPVFITEFGTCDASGNGGFNAEESNDWFKLCKSYSISHINWSLCNKQETASAILFTCKKTNGWTEDDLTESGKLVRNHFKTLSQ